MNFSDAIWNLDATINTGFPTLYNVVQIPSDDDFELI